MVRKDWLVNGDRNSRYFHQSMKVRKIRSKIIKIKDNSGVWVDESAPIEKMLITDFTTRFKSTQAVTSNMEMEILNLVTVADNQRLLEPIQETEIKDALYQMDKLKAPGLDGFGAAFFQDY